MMTVASTHREASPVRGSSPATDATRRVLLVDDDATYARSVRRLLETDGWSVTTVDCPNKALALLGESEFAVVLSDYEMSGIDGVRFLRLVRFSAPNTMRVLLTGNSDFQVAVNAVNEGNVFRFVTKATSSDGLVALIREASEAYVASRTERDSEAEARAQELRTLESQFDAALSGLWMAYQPIISHSQGRVIAYEALLRSTSPDLPNPAKILDAAERLNGVRELGRTVRKRVADELTRTAGIDVFINLHALELLDEALYDERSPLTAHAKRVVLEITERVALTEVVDMRERLTRLRALGFRIAVDDLGAGYAGLGSLVDLEPEVVKIDMGLVRNIPDSPTKQKLVRGVAALGRELGWLLVAEGVENEAERNCLLELGCDIFQGYFYGKPAKLAV
jgi:EAL domain-containing protein (putative c-di-GMP-specific phosphodiesterase class I)